MHQRSSRATRPQEVHNQVERLRMQNRRRLEIFSSSGRSRENENSRANNRADAERRQRPWAQRLAEPVLRVLRLRDQFVDGLTAESLRIRRAYDGGWLRG